MVNQTGSVQSVRVLKKSAVADDVVELVLADPTGERLPAWRPGAHIQVAVPGGLVRQYSLCGADPDADTWTIAVHRSPTSRGGSAYMHDGLDVDAVLDVVGPVHDFPLDGAGPFLFVAGGIGITPILAMVRQLRRDGAAEFELLYCGRSRPLMAYGNEISSWGDDRVTLHADDEQGGLPDLAGLLARHARSTVYCCGPEPLIAAVESLAPDPAAVRVERFRSALQDTSGDVAFDVVVLGTNQRIRVGAQQSVLDALEEAGYDVPFMCREGMCATCETTVVEGVPDHRDSVLDDEEHASNATMTVCCSRAMTATLVLDLDGP